MLIGGSEQPSGKVDSIISPQVRGGLFTDHPPFGAGHDLSALNIQRAREHGIPGECISDCRHIKTRVIYNSPHCVLLQVTRNGVSSATECSKREVCRSSSSTPTSRLGIPSVTTSMPQKYRVCAPCTGKDPLPSFLK